MCLSVSIYLSISPGTPSCMYLECACICATVTGGGGGDRSRPPTMEHKDFTVHVPLVHILAEKLETSAQDIQATGEWCNNSVGTDWDKCALTSGSA